MDVLKLQTNVPVQVAFKYPTGKPCDGMSGPQKMFTFVDGRVTFLSVPAAERIEKQLAELGIGSDEVDLVKAEVRKGNGRGIEYQVKRVNPPANGNGANGSHPPAPPTPALPASDGHQSNGNAQNGNGNGNGQALWASRVKQVTQAKIEIYVELCAWAAERFEGNVSASEVQSFLMNTLISADKNGGSR